MEDMNAIMSLVEGFEGTFALRTNGLFLALLIGIATDFATGIAKGYKLYGRPSSAKLRDGGIKKAGIVLLVILSFGLSYMLTDTKHLLANTVMCYYIYMELISILENLEALGVQLPKIFVKILGEVKDDKKDEEAPTKPKEDPTNAETEE